MLSLKNHRFITATMAVLCMSSVLAGCGSSNADKSKEANKQSVQQQVPKYEKLGTYYFTINAIVVKEPEDIYTAESAISNKDEEALQALMKQGKLYLVKAGTPCTAPEDDPFIKDHVAVNIEGGSNVNKYGYTLGSAISKDKPQ